MKWSTSFFVPTPLLVLVLLTPATVADAHKDRLIRLGADGRLEGFPPEYEPARLSLPTGGRNGPVVLELRGKRLTLPDCLSVLFAKSSRPHMQLSASWYHDPKLLPYYLAIELPSAAPNASGFYDGWSILIDITQVTVLKVEAVFTVGETTQREQEIDIKTFCGSGGVTEVICKAE